MAFSAADQTAVEQAIQDLATGHRLVRITLKGNTNDQSNGHPIIHSAVYPIGHICEPFFLFFRVEYQLYIEGILPANNSQLENGDS